MNRFFLPTAIAAATIAMGSAFAAEPMCATPDQKAKVAEHLKTKAAAIPNGGTARALQLPEEITASALPAGQAVGVKASEFAKIWETMPAWGDVVFLVIKGGNVFEIGSKIMPGKPSTRSNFFNLDGGAPVGGHLRPDLLNSVYVIAVPGGEGGGTMRGALFYGAGGETMFGAFVGGEGGTASPEQLSAFEKTMAVAKSLPKACS